MKVLTVPRAAAALEYKALRAPAQLIQTKLVIRYLPEESALRLGVERTLGKLDRFAGKLLDDPELRQRGDALVTRAAVLETAIKLEDKAERRKADAATTLKRARAEAAQQRDQADARRQADQQRALAQEQANKAAATRHAQSQLKAELHSIDSEAESARAAERARVAAQSERIQRGLDQRTAPAKAQLSDAAKLKQAAAKERAEAQRLEQLAAAEKASRRKS